MKIPFVDLKAQYLTIKEGVDGAIASVIDESSYIRGRHVEDFEKAWAKMFNDRPCVSCANGTDALYIAMKALKIRPGDEVITTAHSWISTSETITQAGGRVVFCDTKADTFLVDEDAIEEKITAKTVGIIPVHLTGLPVDMERVMAIARKHKLWVIEDCAQAHLAEYKGRRAGTFGDAATFSFYPGKNLGAYGDAGCILSESASIAEWMATYARHGGKGEHVMEGINSRLDGIQAAILNVKLPHLLNWTEARRLVAARYDRLLRDVGDVETPVVPSDRRHVYHLYVIKTKHRDSLQKFLANAGIATVINYPRALPFYPAYGYLGAKPEAFPNAFSNQSKILSLPIYPEITDSMIDHVVHTVRQFFDTMGKHT